MAIFTIPKYKMELLRKKVERIRAKGADIVFEIVDDNVYHNYHDESTNANFRIHCYEVEVEGKYIINGWTFVGIIEHSSPENIIRAVDSRFNDIIPEKYWTTPQTCEHCNIRRDRNDTFLVFNEDEYEWKQVGRTCLKNYTKGLDAEISASLVDIFSEIEQLSDEAERGIFEVDVRSNLYSDVVSIEQGTIRRQMLAFVKENGYTPNETVDNFKEHLFEGKKLKLASEAEVKEITEIADKLTSSSWSRNARAAWNKENIELRDLALIASLCSVGLREIEKEKAAKELMQSPTNAYAGEIGDIVEFKIMSAAVAHLRTPPFYGAESYPVYRISDERGLLYYWGRTNPDVVVEAGKMIKGRIKATFERKNGEKITELTRCKVW